MERLFKNGTIANTDKGLSKKIEDFYNDIKSTYGDTYDDADIELYILEELMSLYTIDRAHKRIEDRLNEKKTIKF